MNDQPPFSDTPLRRPARLLIVDDDEEILAALCAMLELDEDRYEVRTAASFDAAIDAARNFLPDLALLDIKLGRDNGMELIPLLRIRVPDMACVMMTAFRDSEYAIRAVQLGANDYLYKPLNPEEIQRVFENQLQRRADAGAREQMSRRFRAVFEQSHQLLFMLDPSGQLIEVNSSVKDVLCLKSGCAASCYIGKPLWAMGCWQVASERRLREIIGEMREGRIVEEELHLLGGEANKLCFAFTFKPIMNPAGELEMILAEGMDITQRVEAEASLRQSNELLEQKVLERTAQLLDAQRIGRIGSWKWDVASGAISWSDEIYRIFGYQLGECQPTYERFMATVHPEDVERIRQSEQQAFSTGAHHSIDHRIILPNGEVRWVHEEARAETNAAGQAIALSGTVQDITERKLIEQSLTQAKESAERANLAKSEFLSRMSHELRTPMNAIMGFSQVLAYESLNEEQLEYVNSIYRAGEHLLELINELLDLARIESGRIHIAMQSVGLLETIEQAVNLVGSLAQGKKITLLNRCKAHAHVHADAIRLKQVLVNLLTNAIKYNHEQGNVEVDCELREGDRICLSVRDDGPGIAEDKLDRLFSPFERLGAEFSDVEGTGIGLAISKRLAELMNASLSVSSTPGEGSVFWIELQLASSEQPEQEMKVQAQPDALPGGKRILYVEDNPANLSLVQAIFRRQPDLTLLTATNGVSGLEVARSARPQVILMDIHLPDMSGFDVFHVLKSHVDTCHIPVIGLSADAMPMDIEHAISAGFHAYLTKPVQVRALLDTVNGCLAALGEV